MPATWTMISTLRWCAAFWKARTRRWCASIPTASPETFSVPPLAIAANLSRAPWPPSPRKTAASFSTCITPAAASPWMPPANRGRSRKFIFTSAASSIASLLASGRTHIKAEFHRHYNSNEVDSSSEYGALIAERMQTERGRLGRFASVRHCIVKRIAEPPYLEADCLSSFQNGDVEEFFIMHHAPNDSHLLSYSAKSHGQEVSIP